VWRAVLLGLATGLFTKHLSHGLPCLVRLWGPHSCKERQAGLLDGLLADDQLFRCCGQLDSIACIACSEVIHCSENRLRRSHSWVSVAFFFTSERKRTHARVPHIRTRRPQFFRSVSFSQLRRADLPRRAHLTLTCAHRQHDAFGIGLCVSAVVRLDGLACHSKLLNHILHVVETDFLCTDAESQ
jgi:hypothetical protein